MKPKFKLALAIALCLGSSQVLAVQLGHIRVRSALDEPLVAEIPLQLDNLAEANGMTVGLASAEDFTRVGLSRAGLDNLRFSVVTDTTGHKLIVITSQGPVSDPFLDFLIEVNTSQGKQLREYTVLLDPVIASPVPQVTAAATAPAAAVAAPASPSPSPVTAPAPTASAASPSEMYSAPVQQSAPPAAPPPAPAPAPVAAPPHPQAPAQPTQQAMPRQTHPQSGEYRVNKGDTLYRIAENTRPDNQVSVDQMMVALQRTNPDAFYRDNINALKSGAILRIPTRDSVSATAAADARAQVHRQIEDWTGAAAHKATTVVQNAPVPAAASRPAKIATANTSDRLALVPPSQGGGSAASHPGEKGGTGSAEIAGLKQQLANARESLASLKQENGGLQSRVKDLEDIGGKNKKLMDMKDAEIAELQRKLAAAQQTAKTASATTSNAAPIANAGAPASVPKPAASKVAAPATIPAGAQKTAPASSAGTTLSPATNAAPEAVKPAAAARPEAKAASQNAANKINAEPWYRQPLAWSIAGIVILGLILLGLVRRRPRPLPEPETDTLPPSDDFHAAAETSAEAAEAHEEYAHEEALAAEDHHEMEAAAAAHEDAAVVVGDDHLHDDHEHMPAEDEYGFAFDELPEETVAAPGMAAPQPPVAGSGDITHLQSLAEFDEHEASPRQFDSPLIHDDDDTREHPVPAFSDDPVDTKLDLARAYLDMGDPAGARAMLEEVLNEGSQMQKDEAKRLLESV